MNIDKILTYIKSCPYLKHTEIHTDYLVNDVIAYSVSEQTSYNPIVSTDIVGNEERQFLFYFDSKLYWNSEIQNNIDNTNFYKNFSSWVQTQNNNKNYPECDSNCKINSISTTTNGFIFDTSEDEAVYRIGCKIEYTKIK